MTNTKQNNQTVLCEHERPPRSKLGLNINDGINFTWEKEYFCKECNWFIGYWSRIRSPLTLRRDCPA